MINSVFVHLLLGLAGRTVSKIPGDTEFTRIWGLTIMARDLARWICAALVTEYACVAWSVHLDARKSEINISSGKKHKLIPYQRTPTWSQPCQASRGNKAPLALIQIFSRRVHKP
jgi:hypothetical protein